MHSTAKHDDQETGWATGGSRTEFPDITLVGPRTQDTDGSTTEIRINGLAMNDRLQYAFGYFESEVDGNMVQNSKPDPEVFLKGAEILALEPKSCIVFEDSQAGIQAAINAGMFSVGVGQEDLESCNFKIENFEGMSPKKLITQLSN